MKIILASKSPRRREILASFGVPFTVLTEDTDESSDIRDPELLVRELALRKGRAVSRALFAGEDALVIASDTVVAVGDHILGKPAGRSEGEEMLRLLSGRAHRVVSGVAILYGGAEYVAAEVTEVCFSEIPERELQWYLDTDEPYDKAGGYAIQGKASLWIEGIRGDYFNVVGLPVHRLDALLKEAIGRGLSSLCGD